MSVHACDTVHVCVCACVIVRVCTSVGEKDGRRKCMCVPQTLTGQSHSNEKPDTPKTIELEKENYPENYKLLQSTTGV